MLLSNQLELREIDKQSIKIHTYLEIGACDERMMNLIKIGLSREAAKEVDDKLQGSVVVDNIYDLIELLDSGELDNVHPITRKEIKYISS